MFKIEELLQLFDNEETKNIIVSSYLISQNSNIELSNIIFEQLFFLKQKNPSLDIRINKSNSSPSNYDIENNTINLNGIFDEATFFHELTHLLSYYNSKFSASNKYNILRNVFISSNENESLLISFLKLCNKEKEKIIESIDREQYSDENNNKTSTKQEKHNNSSLKQYQLQLTIIKFIEDIIDSITIGYSKDFGLKYSKDNTMITEKVERTSGHGCDYYKNTGYEFEEIIANYQAIKLIDPNNYLFKTLKEILGKELVMIIEEKCQLINGQVTDSINNDIIKH